MSTFKEVAGGFLKTAILKLLKTEFWTTISAMLINWAVANSPLPPDVVVALMGSVTALAMWYAGARTSAKNTEKKVEAKLAALKAGILPGDPP